MNESAEGDAAYHLVELPGGEITPLPGEGLVEVLDQRGLANPRVTHDQAHGARRGLAAAHAIEGVEALTQPSVATVERWRDDELIRHAAPAQVKRRDRPSGRYV